MKKILALILAALMMMTMFVACNDESDEDKIKAAAENDESDEDKIKAAAENAYGEVGMETFEEVLDEFEGDERKEIEKLLEKLVDKKIEKMDIEVSDVEIDGDTATAKVKGKSPNEEEATKLLTEKLSGIEQPASQYEQVKILLETMLEVLDEVDHSEEKEAEGKFEKDGDEWVMTNPEVFED